MTFVHPGTAQSTPLRRVHQAVRAAAAGVLFLAFQAPVAGAQTVQRDNEPVFADVGGTRLGRLTAGTVLATGPTRSGHTQITLEGWIFRASLEPASREGYTLQVGKSPEENIRQEPNGRVLAQLVRGTLLTEVERRGQWVKVRRVLWVATSGITNPAAAASRPAAPSSAPAQARAPERAAPQSAPTAPPPQVARAASAPVQAADPQRAVVRRRLQLFRAPDSASVGTLEAGQPVRITARAGGWVRIETQGWVRENEIRLSDAGILTGITAAELRGAPDEFRGRLLRWPIQFLALQTADELRSDFTPGQRYILARGPAPEYAFVYITVPDALLPAVTQLEPLANVTIVGRVINGRSTYLSNPIIELVEIQ